MHYTIFLHLVQIFKARLLNELIEDRVGWVRSCDCRVRLSSNGFEIERLWFVGWLEDLYFIVLSQDAGDMENCEF